MFKPEITISAGCGTCGACGACGLCSLPIIPSSALTVCVDCLLHVLEI